MKVLVLHGVNLNMFGKRDPAQYGTITLKEIDQRLKQLGKELRATVTSYQTNIEGEMCQRIHAAHSDGTAAVLINAGAWTHYSYAIRDALAILKVPIVEVHMSNIHAREGAIHIGRFKGLGEMNADQLKETTMNPDTRRLIAMRLDEAERETAQGVFKLLMAKGEAAGRRAWMEEKGHLIEADL